MEQPRGALDRAGAEAELLSTHDGEIEARQMDLEPAATFKVDKVVSDASVENYDGLVQGGAVNPGKLRMDADAVAFVRAFADGKNRSRRSAMDPVGRRRPAWWPDVG